MQARLNAGRGFAAVLFDLDGTLVDTAPDFVDAINRLRAELGHAPVPASQVQPWVSQGGAAMLRNGVPELADAGPQGLARFLALYRERICVHSALYPGMEAVLELLQRSHTPWGIVTNKPGYLTVPLLAAMGLDAAAAVVVSGDTLPLRKPDPAPVLHACEAMGVAPRSVLMVGDDERDIQAARTAGAASAIAEWGYIEPAAILSGWGADHSLRHPLDLLTLLAPA